MTGVTKMNESKLTKSLHINQDSETTISRLSRDETVSRDSRL